MFGQNSGVLVLVAVSVLLASGCLRCGRPRREAVPAPSLSPQVIEPAAPASGGAPEVAPVAPGFVPNIGRDKAPNAQPGEKGRPNPPGMGAPSEAGAIPSQPNPPGFDIMSEALSGPGLLRNPAMPQNPKTLQELQESGRKPMIPKDPYGTSAEARETLEQMMGQGRTPQPIPTGPLPLPQDMKKIQESGSQPMIPPALAAPTAAPMPSQRLER